MSLRMQVLLAIVSVCGSQLFAGDAPKPAPTQDELEASAALELGNQLKEQGKVAEALVKYKEGLAKDPKRASLLWNAGIASQETGDFNTALDCWKKMRTVEPDNWRIRTKLIQTYQAKGMVKERDEERTALLAFYKKSADPEMVKIGCFCREQFEINKQKGMALEHFELKGEPAVRFAFVVLNEEGKTKYQISLESDTVTNAIMKEHGSVKEGDRGFTLDGYYEGGRLHKTFAIFNSEPSYDDVRKAFIEIVEGKAKALSSSTAGAGK